MIARLNLQANKCSVNRWILPAIGLYAAILLYALRTYILWQSVNVLLGVIALPVVTMIRPGNKKRYRYAVMAIVFSLLSILLPVKTLLYFTIAFALFFMIESFWGAINLLPLAVVALMSPICQYAANIFSFPIRLQLTDWAGAFMSFTGMPVVVKGNMLFFNGNEFSVDPACMGLNMVVTSLLTGIVLTGIYQKKFAVQLPWWWVMGLMLAISISNILSNLFRIVGLVQFNILPGTMMHEVMGIVCLLVYVIIPAVFLTRWMVRKFGKPLRSFTSIRPSVPIRPLVMTHVLLLSCTVLAASGIVQEDARTKNNTAPVAAVQGFTTTRVEAGIVKLESERALVYIKTIPGFYSADHNPMICWRGSGYSFQQVEERMINGMLVYTALLQHEHEQLYTAWWYDNGSKRTIDQLTWRWDVLRGGHQYAVVNVTTTNKDQLEKEIRTIQNKNLFRSLL